MRYVQYNVCTCVHIPIGTNRTSDYTEQCVTGGVLSLTRVHPLPHPSLWNRGGAPVVLQRGTCSGGGGGEW